MTMSGLVAIADPDLAAANRVREELVGTGDEGLVKPADHDHLKEALS